MAIGLYAALVGCSFSEVLAIAANHDGDSDSTASITGQLRGAFAGLSDLPDAWTRRLDLHCPMTWLIREFLRRNGSSPFDTQRPSTLQGS